MIVIGSLWGDDFAPVVTKQSIQKVVKKVDKKPKVIKDVKKQVKSKTLSLDDKLSMIYAEVHRILGKYEENTQVIKTKEEFVFYIDKAIDNNVIAIDTETNNSLEPITCKIMGLCIYTPGLKNAYVPVNHVNKDTGEKLSWQLTEQDIYEQLIRLTNTKIIMHNGKFDYQVIKWTCGVSLDCYWDTLIGSQLLDENESAKLKYQYITKIDPSIEKYSIEGLFKGVQYEVVDPDIFALYAATDSFMTYELYKFQEKQFAKPEMARVYQLFRTVEMPMVLVCGDMESTGVCIDLEYAKRLSSKYHAKLEKLDLTIAKELEKLRPEVEAWKLTAEANVKPPKKTGEGFGKSKAEQLEDPISLSSPTQLAILLYDILKVSCIDKKSPRGTGEEILTKIVEKYPKLTICNLVLEKRGLVKLINTYIDKIPECVCQKDGRLHAHFNQMGEEEHAVRTGRMSSSEPNLQNIPSHNDEIRMLFTASPGYMMIGSDFKAQEPRLLSAYSRDEKMIQNYLEHKDLYATIASFVYNNNYEDNLEFRPDGSYSMEGKARRSNCKSLLLGLMYGRGIASIADQIKDHEGPKTQEDIRRAQEITDLFFQGYPKAKEWIDETQKTAKEKGYVEDLWGRRRRLPDINLPKYEVSFSKEANVSEFNPLLGALGKFSNKNLELVERYKKLAYNSQSRKELEEIKTEAFRDNIYIKDNTSFIAEAERQSVNARIQGGAATITKRALILLRNNKRLQELNFRALIPVHDEIIAECPIEHVEECSKLMSELMSAAAKPECVVPMECDVATFSSWYIDVYEADVIKKFNKLVSSGMSKEEAKNKIIETNTECTEEQLIDMLSSVL